jgi:hypothetical protein
MEYHYLGVIIIITSTIIITEGIEKLVLIVKGPFSE